jgi:hypothetical protein
MPQVRDLRRISALRRGSRLSRVSRRSQLFAGPAVSGRLTWTAFDKSR